ncbi:unnamed protein product [Cladocopium goreaui]|uniref:Uncharacterized protein n=1 Tax=Cladocopium goreaui TaxID=2562237 RepID=A0A9P1CYZ2_9DINO|nr:unnamed protein product [Cladocopium goreaui]
MSMLGSVTQLTGTNVEAQRWLRRALDILESEPQESLELARKATKAFDAAAELDNAADASRLVVSATFSSGDVEAAVSLASEQLEAAQRGSDLMQAYAHLMWAELMLALGKTSELKEHAAQAEQVFHRLEKMSYVAKCKAAVAQACIQECDGIESERLAQEVLTIWQNLGDKAGTAVAWHLLSAARSVSGEGNLMEPLTKALDLYKELRWSRYEATVLYNLSERQRFQPHGGAVAQRTAEEAVSIWKEIGNYKGEATAMTAVAKAMIVRGLVSDALQLVQNRMQELRSEENKQALSQLGPGCVSVLQECGAKDEALATAEEVLGITQQLGNRHEEAWILLKLAEVRNEMQLYQEALSCAQEAQTIFQELGDLSGEADAMKSLSYIYTAKREAHKSPHRQKALDLLSQFATSVGKKDVEGFQKALTQMRLYQGVDGQDVAASLGSLMEDPETYKWYVEASADYFQVSFEEAESMVGRAPLNPMQRATAFDSRGFAGGGVYLMFRFGAMGYGPSFRPIQQGYRQGHKSEAEQGDPPTALAVLRDETVEEWERVALLQAHAGVLDGALQTTALYHESFTGPISSRLRQQEIQAS